MKKILLALALAVSAINCNAQFVSGQVLTAGELNSAFSKYMPTTGGVFSGAVTAPQLTVTGQSILPSVAITGGTISALTTPLPIAAGGTGANTGSGTVLDAISGFNSTGFITRTGAGTYGFVSTSNGIPFSSLTQLNANSVLGNTNTSSASGTSVSLPSCATSSSSLLYTLNTGFSCNTSINAASLGGLSAASYLTVSTAASTYAPLASPTFTGTVTIPAGASISGYLTTATAASTYAPIASPTFTGTVTAPTLSSTTANITTGNLTNLNVTGAMTGVTGRLLNVQVLTASGTYTPTTGTNSIIVEVQGGGGAGGGAPATGAGQEGIGGGGSAGGYIKSRLTSGFSGATVTIGAGGTPVSGGTGGAGGNTVFGSLTAGGGTGGVVQGPSSGNMNANAIQTGGAASGGNILNIKGATGTASLYVGVVLGGIGGATPLGSGGGWGISSGQAAGAGSGYGSGGGGMINASSVAAAPGGAGAPGVVIVWEYQ